MIRSLSVLALVAMSTVAQADPEAARRQALAKKAAPSLVRVEVTVRVQIARLPGVGASARRTHRVSLAGVVVDAKGLVVFSAAGLDPGRAAYAALGAGGLAEVARVQVAGGDGRIRSASWVGRDPASGLAFARVAPSSVAGTKAVTWPAKAPRPAMGDALYALYLSPPSLGHALAVEGVRVAAAKAPRASISPRLPHAHGALLVTPEGGVVGLLLPTPAPKGHDPLRPDLSAEAAAGRLVLADSLQAALRSLPKEAAVSPGLKRARPWLGARTRVLTPELAKSLGLDVDVGVYVDEVFNGPAQVAGVQAGDSILRLDGEPLDLDPGETLADLIADYAVGEEIKLVIRRQRKNKGVTLRLGRGPLRADQVERVRIAPLGLTLRDLTFFDRKAAKLAAAAKGAVVVDIDPDGAASRAGLRVGDMILGVGDEAPQSLADLKRLALRDGPQPLRVRRSGKDLTLRVRR